MTEGTRSRLSLVECAAVAAAGLASHATALRGSYVWLDHAHLEEGLAIAGGDSGASLASLFTRGFAGTGYYRPLMAVSLSLDAALAKTPALFRAVTLGWHAAASVLTVLAAQALGLPRRAAVLAGLLFAVHPATSLVASATAFRSESMTVVFLLGLVVAHVAGRPMLAAGALLLGALSKETAWVLGPLFVVSLELAARRRPGAIGAGRKVLVAEGVAFVVAAALHFRYAPSFRASHAALSAGDAIGTRLAALGKSAFALLLPLDGSICDAFPVTSAVSVSALLGGAVLAGVIALTARGGVLALLFALSLLPSLQLVPVMRWWSPHYLYLPLVFGAMLVAEAVERRLRRPWPAAAAVLAPLGLLSLREGTRYENDLALFGPEVEREPACREGHFFLGEVARRRSDWESAASHYEQAASPVPGYLSYADEASALQNLGAARYAQERWTEARGAWTAALERPGDEDEKRHLAHNVATLALRTGDAAGAVRVLEPERDRADALPESLFVLARALHELGRDEEASQLVPRFMGKLAPRD